MLRLIADSVLANRSISRKGINFFANAQSRKTLIHAQNLETRAIHYVTSFISPAQKSIPVKDRALVLGGQFFFTSRQCRGSSIVPPIVTISRSYQLSNQGVVTSNILAQGKKLFSTGRSSKHNQLQSQSSRATSGVSSIKRFSNNFSVDSSNKVVYAIIAINVGVFLTWKYAEGNARQFRDPRLFYFMFQNFTASGQNLREGRVWTLITSSFSHIEWYHILLNVMVLMSFGDPVWRMLGTRKFLAVYLGAGISSSLSSIGYYSYLEPYLRRIQNKPINYSPHYSLGASGSIMGITTTFACVYPLSTFSLFFFINMPAAALIGLFGVYELYNVLSASTGKFDSAGHLGGGLFGAGYYLFYRYRPTIRRIIRK